MRPTVTRKLSVSLCVFVRRFTSRSFNRCRSSSWQQALLQTRKRRWFPRALALLPQLPHWLRLQVQA
jgi:hypothetical protein